VALWDSKGCKHQMPVDAVGRFDRNALAIVIWDIVKNIFVIIISFTIAHLCVRPCNLSQYLVIYIHIYLKIVFIV